jgi:hypothetical protein
VHLIIPFLLCQVQGPIVRSKLRLSLVAEAGVEFLQGEEDDEEGVTGYWGRDERLRTDEFAIVSVWKFLNCL